MDISFPCKIDDIKCLKLGDRVNINGNLLTARDDAHKKLIECLKVEGQKIKIKMLFNELKELLKNGAIFHCGPIMINQKGGWICLGAGPTTSTRMDIYTPDIIKNYKVRGIIGKGGMNIEVKKALQQNCGVYFQTIGGASALLSKCVIKVNKVFFLEEMGIPEAIWSLTVKNLPAFVSMDCYGNSIYEIVEKRAFEIAKKFKLY